MSTENCDAKRMADWLLENSCRAGFVEEYKEAWSVTMRNF